MSFSGVARISPDLTIPSGAAVSNVLNAKQHYEDAAAIVIQSPATLDALTFKIEVSIDGVTYVDYQEGATLADVPMPAADNGIALDLLCAWPYFRLAASGNVAADRVFMVAKHFTMR